MTNVSIFYNQPVDLLSNRRNFLSHLESDRLKRPNYQLMLGFLQFKGAPPQDDSY